MFFFLTISFVNRRRLALVILAAVMLFLAFLGFCKFFFSPRITCFLFSCFVLDFSSITGVSFSRCGLFSLQYFQY